MKTLEEITAEIRNRMHRSKGANALSVNVAELRRLLDAVDSVVNKPASPTTAITRAIVVTKPHGMDTAVLIIGATSPLIGQEGSADATVYCSKGHGVRWVRENFGIEADVVNRGAE